MWAALSSLHAAASQRCIYSLCNIRNFFNRTSELRLLEELTQDGELILITGPPDCGKTALLKHFEKKQREEKKGYPIMIDMRRGTFNTASTFCRALKDELHPFLKMLYSALKEVRTADSHLEMSKDLLVAAIGTMEKSSINDMNGVLQALESLCFNHRSYSKALMFGKHAGFPTMIIDEANRLHEWSTTPEEQDNLRILESFFIKITKQDHTANVVLCTSEDFFRFWIGARIGESRFRFGVVGDLTEAEAKEFFTQLVSRNLSVQPRHACTNALWNNVYNYVGGRIMLLEIVANHLKHAANDHIDMECRWKSLKDDFESRMLGEMKRALNPTKLPSKWTRPPLGLVTKEYKFSLLPLWSRQEWETILVKLTDAPGGVLSQEVLEQEVSLEGLYSLIQHNFLHFRERSMWARDMAWYKGCWPIVMATSMRCNPL